MRDDGCDRSQSVRAHKDKLSHTLPESWLAAALE
jgi:hypothetical protein